MQNRVYQVITDRIVEMLSRGVIPWRKTWSGSGSGSSEPLYAQYSYSERGLRAYRGINPFLLAGRYSIPYWVTYRQAEALGGHVRQGEKSSIVIFWKKEEKETKEIDIKTGKPKKEKIMILRYYSVFNIEQCDGVPLPSQEMLNKTEKPKIMTCEEILTNMAEKPVLTNSERAFYSPSGDYIGIPDISAFESAEAYYSTLYHEIAHWTGHNTRLDRPGIKNPSFGSEIYSKEELVAEMAAAFLCDITQISPRTLENSAAYIGSWLKVLKNDVSMVVLAAAAAQRAADYITNSKANAAPVCGAAATEAV